MTIFDALVAKNISSGGGGGTSVVKVDFTYTKNGNTETWTLDKTFNEINEEFKKGNIVMIRETNGMWYQAVCVTGNARVLRYITTGGSSSSPTIVCKAYSYSGSGGVDDYPSYSYTESDN